MRMPIASTILHALAAVWILCARAGASDFVLFDADLRTQPISVVEINDELLAYLDDAGELHATAMGQCIALAQSVGAAERRDRARGFVLLTDGQRLPGLPAVSSVAGGQDAVAWVHPWLGRVDIPLDHVASITLDPARMPLEPGGADTILLTNGDRLEGFIAGIGAAVIIELDSNQLSDVVEIPLDRVAAITFISAQRAPEGRRIWFDDTTVLDAIHLSVGDDGYVRLSSALSPAGAQPIQRRLTDITAILFDTDAMLSLSGIEPSLVESTSLRYVVPEPRILAGEAPLGLASIEYRGPLIVRYALPVGCRRFAAQAVLPGCDHAWGDYELIIRDDDREVFRARLNADHPNETINVPLAGLELTIELTQGANGPIQDRLVLSRAMLLIER